MVNEREIFFVASNGSKMSIVNDVGYKSLWSEALWKFSDRKRKKLKFKTFCFLSEFKWIYEKLHNFLHFSNSYHVKNSTLSNNKSCHKTVHHNFGTKISQVFTNSIINKQQKNLQQSKFIDITSGLSPSSLNEQALSISIKVSTEIFLIHALNFNNLTPDTQFIKLRVIKFH